jgi:hypothetical protein
MRPYKEKIISENKRVRKFSKDVNSHDLIWHRDEHCRVVEVVSGVGWSFQRDNELPISLRSGDVFKIEKETWHRLSKGESDLVVMIAEKKEKKSLPSQYGAPPKSKRAKLLKKAAELYKQGDIKGAAKIRQDMEAKHMDESLLREMINNIAEEMKLDELLKELEQNIQEKKGKSPKGLSKAVKKSLDKKADKRCLTRGSVYAEFRAGLAAFLSSGSRKGMSAHQWAHARVNSANPSKKWAKVSKRKKCPKKKK